MSPDMHTDAVLLLRAIQAERAARYREEAVERQRHAEITLWYTYLDDGIHLSCGCDWEINLDFNPSPEDAFFFAAEHRRTAMAEFAAKRDAERAALTEPETGQFEVTHPPLDMPVKPSAALDHLRDAVADAAESGKGLAP